jgi:TusE/DsrC/DsvC family sulfur relay protein
MDPRPALPTERLASIEARLDTLSQQMAYLVERQKKSEELFTEATPILRAVMATATTRLDDLEKRGYFAVAREFVRVGERVVERYGAQDVQALGDAIVDILETVRALTQPEVLAIAGEATTAIHNVNTVEPLGILGMVKATRDDNVQRGMAVMMDVMRHVGRAADALAAQKRPSAAESRRDKLDAITGSRRKKALGIERTPPPRPVAPARPAPARPAAPVTAAAPAAPAADTTLLGGVAFTPDGHLADPNAWTPALADTLAAALGVELDEARRKVIDFARADFLKTGSSPNIRRITLEMGLSTKDIYALFPKAPARTIAKIAGIPKPAGCL